MRSVFLSYSREDFLHIEQLEVQLKRQPELSIWRDQDKIYGGEKWPKVLGEAIADQDVFLLAWSKNAAASHFVEFEWCTAIALKKTVVPCLLDHTPLAPSLKAFQSHAMNDTVGLLTALSQVPLADEGRRTPVIRKLNDIAATEESTVLAQAKTVFGQEKWTVQGNVYQAGGDIHFHNEPATSSVPEKVKPLVEKWQAWVTLAGGFLTVIALGAGLSEKLGSQLFSTEDEIMDQLLSGSVQDAETNEPLAGVDVTLLDQGLTVTTNPTGHFELRLRATKQDIVSVAARKDGYISAEPQKQILGDLKVKILLKKRRVP